MRIIIEKDNLVKNIQAIIGIVNPKNTLPILSNILIETEKKNLKLTTTDLDVGMVIIMEAQILEEGDITIPAKRLLDIIKELPDKTIEINTKRNNMINIECKGIIFKILGIPKDEFPKLPTITTKEQIILKQSDLKKMLSMTSFAMSHDETRYVLNGICFLVTRDFISLVATDGRRLAIIKQPNKTGFAQDKKIIIPTKTVQELSRSLMEDGDAVITFSKNQAMFQVGGLLIVSRLIEGEFPNYEQAIPKEPKNKIKIGREKLYSAAKRMSLLTTQESQAIKIELQQNRLTASKSTPEIGEAKEEIDIEYSGEALVVGFNPAYLSDVLKNIDEEMVELELTGPEKPGVIRTAGGYLYIVLPMQIV